MPVKTWLEPLYQSWWRTVAVPTAALIVMIAVAFIPSFWLSILILFPMGMALSFFGFSLLFSTPEKFDITRLPHLVWPDPHGETEEASDAVLEQYYRDKRHAIDEAFYQHQMKEKRCFFLGASLAFSSVVGCLIIALASL